jgi:hypothetical protein
LKGNRIFLNDWGTAIHALESGCHVIPLRGAARLGTGVSRPGADRPKILRHRDAAVVESRRSYMSGRMPNIL